MYTARLPQDAPSKPRLTGIGGPSCAGKTEEVDVPVYDFAHYVRNPAVGRVQAGEFVILEGLFALHWEQSRGFLDVKVFVVADDAICLNRRLERGIRERGRSRESVLAYRPPHGGEVRPARPPRCGSGARRRRTDRTVRGGSAAIDTP